MDMEQAEMTLNRVFGPFHNAQHELAFQRAYVNGTNSYTITRACHARVPERLCQWYKYVYTYMTRARHARVPEFLCRWYTRVPMWMVHIDIEFLCQWYTYVYTYITRARRARVPACLCNGRPTL